MAIYKKGREPEKKKVCCPLKKEDKCEEPVVLNSFYCAGDAIPVESVGKVIVCLEDGTEECLVHGDMIPHDINGFVLLDPKSLRMKYVPGKAPVDIAQLVCNLLDRYGAINKDDAKCIAKAVFLTCFNENVNKELISGYVAKCLLESDLPTSGQITEQISSAIAEIDIPDAEYIKSLIDQCQRSEDAIKLIIQQEIASAGVPTTINIETIAKMVATACFSDLISGYCTKSEINALVQAALDQAGILSEQEVRLIARQEAVSEVNAYPFKAMIQQCIDAAGISTVAQIQQIASEQAANAVGALSIPSQMLIESWAKAVAVVCIRTELDNTYTPTRDELIALIKETTFDCLKDLIDLEKTVSVCYEHGGPVFSQDENGKITLIDCVKADGFNGSCEAATYDPNQGCRVIPYTGPTQEQIETIAEQHLSGDLCVTGISFDYNPATGQFSGSVTDHCGTQSDTVILPLNSGSTDGGLTAAEVTALISAYLSTNSQDFCNTGLGLSVDNVNNSLTVSITDDCGTISQTANLPVSTGGGLTAAQVNQLIADYVAANENLFCNSTVTATYDENTNDLTVFVTDNCGTKAGLVNIPISAGGADNCITQTSFGLNGSTLSLAIEQENCATITSSIVLPLDGNGNIVECCNTGFDAVTFNPDTCEVTATLNQSNGNPVSLTLPLDDFITTETITHTDGCSQYNELKLGNKVLLRAPIWEPEEGDCVRMCASSYTGNQIVGPVAVDVVITIDDLGFTYLLPAGQTFNYFDETGANLQDFTGPIDICVSDVCDNEAFREINTITAVPTHKNC